MNFSILTGLLDTAGTTTDTTTTGGGGWFIWVLLGLMVVYMIYSVISGKKKQKKEQQEIEALQAGDEVTTIGGIIGKVVSIKEQTFVLETTKDRTRIRFHKGAIRSIDVKIADLARESEEQTVEPEKAVTKEEKAENKPEA